MSITIDLSGLHTALEKEAEKIQKAIRPAAQAGAQIIYDQARLKCPTGDKEHYFYGKSFKTNGTKYLFKAGTLKDSIYQVYSKSNSGLNKATYHIAWNHQKAPYGFMVELGTKHADAHPFLLPAIIDNKEKAEKAIKKRFIEEMKK